MSKNKSRSNSGSNISRLSSKYSHLQAKPKHLPKYKTALFIFLCTSLSFVLSRLFIFPHINRNKTENSPFVQAEQNDPLDNYIGPDQNNPLFETKPKWSQDFTIENANFDGRAWNIVVGPAQNSNNEQQYYSNSPSNLRIEGGALRLIATRQSQPENYQYASARIETQGKKTFTYGRIDIEAKLPTGVGTWPAIWLLPANNKYANLSSENNPIRYKNGGEIDIVEAVGFHPDTVYAVAHTLSDLQIRSDGTGSHSAVNVPHSSTKFNKYSLLWTPDKMEFLVNEKLFFTYVKKEGSNYMTWPFDQPFYLIINLALGGSWGGMDTVHFPGNGIDNGALPTSLDIRSIHYYSYKGLQPN